VTLTQADNGATWQAAPGNKPVISGSIQVTGWTLFAVVGGQNVYSANVPGGTNSRQLFVNGVRATRARYPNANTAPADLSGYVAQSGGFSLDASDPNNVLSWPDNLSIEWVGISDCWTLRCAASSITSGGIAIENPCWTSSQQIQNPWQLLSWYENAYELLDAPGEWFLNVGTHTLYYMPRIGETIGSADVELPIAETLFAIDGTPSAPVSGVTVQGITFENSTWLYPSTSTNGFVSWCDGTHAIAQLSVPYATMPVQSTLSMTPSALDLQGAIGATITANTFTALGAGAAWVHNGSQNSAFRSNVITDVSGPGVVVGDVTHVVDHHPALADDAGIPVSQLVVSGNSVTNNEIQRVGQEYYSSPGVFVGFTTATSVTGNDISFTPYDAILVGWGCGGYDPGFIQGYTTPTTLQRNLVTRNRIGYPCVGVPGNSGNQLFDCGGILTDSADPDAGISNNFMHDQGQSYGNYFIDNGAANNTIAANCAFQGEPEPDIQSWMFLEIANPNPAAQEYAAVNNIVAGNWATSTTLSPVGSPDPSNTYSSPTLVSSLYTTGGTDGGLGPCAAVLAAAGSSLRDPEVAYAKPASLSNGGGNAWVGNDLYGYDNIEIAASGTISWWQVDLGAAYAVTEIVYIPSWIGVVDATGRRNIAVEVSNDPTFAVGVTVVGGIDANGIPWMSPLIVSISPAVGARYVRVSKTVTNENFYVGEVLVYGH
jgi:hypothetical protein